MKKTVSVLLAVLMLVLCALPVSAISISKGTDALNKTMPDGKNSDVNIDYVYFSPVKGNSDTTKYPIFVWLHGMNSGKVKRQQLSWYEFSNWASDEYQSRFENAGGCFLLAPRANNSQNNWDGTDCSVLKKVIDAFIAQYADNIDTDRIYIGGYSTGGTMVWEMLSQYPDFFAAGLPLASITQPSSSQLSQLGKVSIWMMASDNDPYPLAGSEDAITTFNYLQSTTNRKTGVRITTFSDVVFADYTRRTVWSDGKYVVSDKAQHYLWEAVTYDMHMSDGKTPYVNTTTKDAAGNTITFEDPTEGVISWLSAQSKTSENTTNNVSFLQRIILAIKKFFQMFATIFKRFK